MHGYSEEISKYGCNPNASQNVAFYDESDVQLSKTVWAVLGE
jgi:hypothetical protein